MLFRASEKIPLCGNNQKIYNVLGVQHTKKLSEIIEEMISKELKGYV